MWVWADGGLINCDLLQKIKTVKRLDKKHFVMGVAPHGNIMLSEHESEQKASEALRALCNRLNRERK